MIEIYLRCCRLIGLLGAPTRKVFLVYSKGQGSLSKATLLQVVTFPKACSVSSAALSCCAAALSGGCYSLLLVLSLLDDALYSVVVVQSVHSAYIQQCSAALPDWLNAVRKLSSVCTETLSLFKPCRVPILHIWSKLILKFVQFWKVWNSYCLNVVKYYLA